MYIELDPTQSNRLNAYQQQAEKLAKARQEQGSAQSGQVAASQGDSVNLSQEAKLLAEANRTAKDAEDVRQEKIDMLKAQVENGTYEVDSRRIAEGLVREQLDLWG